MTDDEPQDVDVELEEEAILDQVFTGVRHVFLRMDEKSDKDMSLVWKAKEIGVYDKGMKHEERLSELWRSTGLKRVAVITSV